MCVLRDIHIYLNVSESIVSHVSKCRRQALPFYSSFLAAAAPHYNILMFRDLSRLDSLIYMCFTVSSHLSRSSSNPLVCLLITQYYKCVYDIEKECERERERHVDVRHRMNNNKIEEVMIIMKDFNLKALLKF